MKIITLNTWGGKVSEPLKLFFSEHKDVEVFCLQEVYKEGYGLETDPNFQDVMFDLFNDIQEQLPEHVGFFNPQIDDHYGLAMFIKKDITIVDQGDIFIHKYKEFVPEGNLGFHARNMQHATLETDSEKISILNVHGLWNGQGKSDTDDRILQSQNIIDFCKTLSNKFILCGDFNLLPDTQSVKMLEETDLRNLIKEYNIQSTRTSFYEKPGKFADYIFVTPKIDVKEFKVLPEEVSDHAALYLEI